MVCSTGRAVGSMMSFRSAAPAPPKFELLSLEFQVQVDHRMGVQEVTFEVSEQGRSWCLERNVFRARGREQRVGREAGSREQRVGREARTGNALVFPRSKRFCSPKLFKQNTKARGRR